MAGTDEAGVNQEAAGVPETLTGRLNVLVTGTAGFIGFHLTERLLQAGHRVVGLDNVNDYYDVRLKLDRLAHHGVVPPAASVQESTARLAGLQAGQVHASESRPEYTFVRMDLQDRQGILDLFERERFDVVVNLAAQAGVRHSLTHPHDYVDYNVTGFLNILEACRAHPVGHLIYASSSSVYGLNTVMPFSVRHNVDHPISLYAATKKANELMGHTYSHLFGIPTTGLRFFTVYGPWGRPDMALFLFTRAMLAGEPIQVFNHGEMSRDFTYVSDIVESIARLAPRPPQGNPDWDGARPDPSSARSPYRIFNIGHNSPVRLLDFIAEIERNLGVEARKEMLPIQPGDVPATYADVTDLFDYTGYKPKVGIAEWVKAFVNWYLDYYKLERPG